MTHKEATSHRLRTFLPELERMQRAKQKAVYQGPLGRLGRTPSSRYRLLLVSGTLTLLSLVLAAAFSPLLTALLGLGLVAVMALGWPAATGIAELRGQSRINSHALIVFLTGSLSILLTVLLSQKAPLEYLPAVAAVGVVASFMVELARGEGAVGRLESVISCVSGMLAAVSVAGWVGLAQLAQQTQARTPVVLIGLLIALVLALFAGRLISAGPQSGPRRGAVTLGVTPVAFVGAISYISATLLTYMIG